MEAGPSLGDSPAFSAVTGIDSVIEVDSTAPKSMASNALPSCSFPRLALSKHSSTASAPVISVTVWAFGLGRQPQVQIVRLKELQKEVDQPS
jgi:hypothetical protein